MWANPVATEATSRMTSAAGGRTRDPEKPTPSCPLVPRPQHRSPCVAASTTQVCEAPAERASISGRVYIADLVRDCDGEPVVELEVDQDADDVPDGVPLGVTLGEGSVVNVGLTDEDTVGDDDADTETDALLPSDDDMVTEGVSEAGVGCDVKEPEQEALALLLCDGDNESEIVALAVLDADAVAESETDNDQEGELDNDAEGDGEPVSDTVGEGDLDSEGELDGDGDIQGNSTRDCDER